MNLEGEGLRGGRGGGPAWGPDEELAGAEYQQYHIHPLGLVEQPRQSQATLRIHPTGSQPALPASQWGVYILVTSEENTFCWHLCEDYEDICC